MDNIHDLHFLQTQLEELHQQGLYKNFPTIESANEAMILIEGQKIINLCSNNYLGFANHPRLKQAAIKAVEKYGVGAGAVKTIVGNMDIHEQLEKKLAEFKQEEAVMLFQSGFNCNMGVIQAITQANDLIISDELNHASIIDGIRLSKADRAVYKHSDMNHLKSILQEKRSTYKQVLIITDGVFSMDGDLAKLPEIVEIAEEFQCMTYVDDAHGSGILGKNGRGTVDHFDLHGRIDFTIGTLSKAFGVIGGYVACKQVAKDWLSQRARPLLFSTYLPPAVIGALLEAIDMLLESDTYTQLCWDNAHYFKSEMKKLGFNIGRSETPITPVFIFDESKTISFSKSLLKKGILVSPIIFPTVPKGQGRIRVMVTAQHDQKMLDEAIAIFKQVGLEQGII